MRIGIKYKLVLAFLLSNALLAILMFAISSWRFDRGFLEYLTEIEVQRMQPLLVDLATAYSDQQSWQPMLNDPQRWDTLMFRHVRPNMAPPPVAGLRRPPPRLGGRPPGPPPGPPPRGRHEPGEFAPLRPSLFDPRLILADQNRNRLIGPPENEQNFVVWLNIVAANQVVGYLGIIRYGRGENLPDNLFLEEQTTAYGWIAFGSLFIALGIGLSLAIIWLRPIYQLQRALVLLSAGDFSQRLKQSGNDEMSDLANRFNSLARTLDENKTIQNQWATDISHELRTPLAILIGEIEALVDGIRPINEKRLQSLHEEALHLQSIVNQLHELNLSDLGSLSYNKSSIDFTLFFSNLIRQITPVCEKQGLKLQYSRRSEPASVEMDEQKFKQLFTNLFHNSLRYTDKPGELRIDWQVSNGELVLLWSDSYPSVGAAEKSKLFDRLYRAESSRNRRTGGSGLGLAIVKNIIEAHDGSIEVTDSALGGLEFTLRIPTH